MKIQKEGIGLHDFNPIEKNLEIGLFDLRCEKIENSYISDILSRGIALTGAEPIKQMDHKFKPQGASLVQLLQETYIKYESCVEGEKEITYFYPLNESHAVVHITPETKPNYISVYISTCGNTEPFMATKFLITELKPVNCEVKYHKLKTDYWKSDFPKSLEEFVEKFKEQLSVEGYEVSSEMGGKNSFTSQFTRKY